MAIGGSIAIDDAVRDRFLGGRNFYLPAVNVEVETSNDGISVVDGNRSDIRKRLDLSSDVLALVIGQCEAQLANSCLDLRGKMLVIRINAKRMLMLTAFQPVRRDAKWT